MKFIFFLLTLYTWSITGSKTVQDYLQDAKSQIASGNIPDAIQSYTAAIDLEPSDYMNLFRRAILYIKQGNNQNAIRDLDRVLQLKSDHSSSLLQKAKLLLMEGRIQESILDFEKYSILVPTDQEAKETHSQAQQALVQISNADVYIKNQQWEQAIEALQPVVSLCIRSVDLRLKRAECHTKLGHPIMAISDLELAVGFRPDMLNVYINLSNLKMGLGEVSSALKSVRDCLKLDPENKPCKTEFRKLKQLEKDVAKLQDAVSKSKVLTARDLLFENNALLSKWETLDKGALKAKIYGFACKVQGLLKKNDEAIEWCTKALELDSENVEALTTRAEAKINTDEFEDAVRDYQKAHELDKENREIAENYQKAQRLLRQAGKRDYYKILGVSRTATSREIKKAFRKLAQQWHPDKYKGDLPKETVAKKMSDISQAYEVLSNEELKTRYDNGDDPNDPQGGFGGGNPFGGGGFPFGGFHQGGGHQFGGGQRFTFHF